MRADEVRERMAGTVFGSVRFVGATGSTNADLLAAARDGASEGLVLVADHQTAGRGRRGRSWVAPPGAALLASVLLRPQAGSAALTLLSPAVGLAVRDACADVGADVQLKWPNDVIARVPGEAGALGEAKLAGVLAESDVAGGTAAVVAGFGVNLLSHPALSATVAAQVGETERDFAPLPPTALDALAVVPPSRDELLISVLVRLDAWYRHLRDPAGERDLLDELRRNSATLGRHVRVLTPAGAVAGRAADLTAGGHLVVVTDAGPVTVTAGDCHHLRSEPA